MEELLLAWMREYGYGILFLWSILEGESGLVMAGLFALINLLSAFCWSSFIILPVWYFGNEILSLIEWAKAHWYFALPFVGMLFSGVYYYFHKMTAKTLRAKRG